MRNVIRELICTSVKQATASKFLRFRATFFLRTKGSKNECVHSIDEATRMNLLDLFDTLRTCG
jgi:hypothetical protein